MWLELPTEEADSGQSRCALMLDIGAPRTDVAQAKQVSAV
jgi:hypothetical protein